MFTKNIKNTFTQGLLDAVSGVLGEAKKKPCSEGCECEACEPEETNEGCMPTNDMPSAKDRATAGKLGALLKRERDAKEKKEPNGVKTEDTDMPWAEDPNNPTRKAGTRKDEYGNKIKNVAKHLAKKAMKANEEVEEIEEKRGLWDNIHAKRKRIKAGSGERMRKPGSEGAPSAADLKASQKEEVQIDDAFEQIDEAINWTAHNAIVKGHEGKTYNDIFNAHGSSIHNKIRAVRKERDNQPGTTHHATFLHDRMLKAYAHWYRDKKAVKEESEQIDEISKPTLGRYINKAKDSIDMASYRQGHKEAHGSSSKALEKKLTKRHKGISTAVKKLTKEEQEFIDTLNDADMEQIDELSVVGLDKYHSKAYQSMFDKDSDKKTVAKRKKGMDMAYNKAGFGKAKVYASEEAELEEGEEKGGGYDGMPKGLQDRAPRGRARNAMGRAIAKQERNLARARMDRAARKMEEEVEQVDEVSKNLMLRYVSKAKKSAAVSTPKTFVKRMRGTDMAVRKYTATDKKYVRVPATEEVEISEARGRPRKAGAKDFTIHPKTKEKLMHNNPEHVKRIERLQKNGILPKPKTEANQHIIQQLQRVKTSMRGGETVNFTHGDSKHVAGTHAAKLLDKYAGMRPSEKEAFQKKIGHSHENLKSEL